MSIKARMNRLNALVELGLLSEDEREVKASQLAMTVPAE